MVNNDGQALYVVGVRSFVDAEYIGAHHVEVCRHLKAVKWAFVGIIY